MNLLLLTAYSFKSIDRPIKIHMKSVEIKNSDQLPGKKLSENSIFSFRCYPEISCFNQCCRNLNLFLYPYDVIRLKINLGISSDEFLDKHVDVVLRPGNFFPDVVLRMDEKREMVCPFLSDSGCRVYPDRPDACRTFPVEQGMIIDPKKKETRLVHYFRPPDFCKGQYETQLWTPKSWEKDQEAENYHKMTAQWAKLKGLFQNNPWGNEGPDGQKARMAFMATYNMDAFRNFIFTSTFLKRYKVKSTIVKKIKTNDTDLLKLGFDWVKFFIWAIPSENIRLNRVR
jgi:hypothetical protein